MSYGNLIKLVEDQYNSYRRIYYYLINCDALLLNWNQIDQKKLKLLIDSGDLEALKEYMDSFEPLILWSCKRLREYAKSMQIPNYSRLCREQLISELLDEEGRLTRVYSQQNRAVQLSPQSERIEQFLGSPREFERDDNGDTQ